MKKYRVKIITTIIICCVLIVAYFLGGDYAVRDISSPLSTSVESIDNTELANPSVLEPLKEPQSHQHEGSSEGGYNGSEGYSVEQGMVIDPETGKDRYLTDPVPEGKPVPVEPQDIEIRDTTYTCTLFVRCDNILKNIDHLDKEKIELVPDEGVIFKASEVTFYEGETVFNVLLREMKKNKIHMEFENTPMYNSAYIEGINNLYEFDCGELSGWMYKVNGWFPNYGCSRYQLKAGDVVEWVYTCDLGRDVGGYYATGGKE